MSEVTQCPKCSSTDRHKAGFIGDKQRWRCRSCGCKYTRSTPRGSDPTIKRLALQLYLEGMGFRAIGRILGVSNVAVLKWIRAFGEEIEEIRKPSSRPKIAVIDEMWHFVHSKKAKSGSGFLCVISQDGSSAFIWENEEKQI